MVGEILIRTSRINATRGHRFYDEREPIEGTIFEDYERDELRGELFRFGLREYGRCSGKVYIDTPDAPVHCGYVFEQREPYEDTGELFLCETWLTFERVVEPARPTMVAALAL